MRELFCAGTFAHSNANTHMPLTPHPGMQLATQSENKLWHWRNKHALITHKHVDSRSGAVKSQLIFSLATHPSSSPPSSSPPSYLHPLLFHCHNTTSWLYISVGSANSADLHVSSCVHQLPLDMRAAAADAAAAVAEEAEAERERRQLPLHCLTRYASLLAGSSCCDTLQTRTGKRHGYTHSQAPLSRFCVQLQ